MTYITDVSRLPSVPMEERAFLPTTPGVYFVIDQVGLILYIGQSENLQKRWAGRSHHIFCGKAVYPPRVRIAWLSVPAKDLLLVIEEALIRAFEPPLNSIPCGPQVKLSGASPSVVYRQQKYRSASRVPKGSVSVGVDRGWLRLRWRYGDRKYSMAVGLPDTAVNRGFAVQLANVIERDMDAERLFPGSFDASLKKYKAAS